MKILRRLFILAVAALCLLMACDRPEVKEPVKIRLNKELMSSLRVGETQKLEASVTPHDAEVTLVWSSDNESVAVVDDEGNVTGVAPGTAEVSVQADDAVAKCKVVVLALKPKGINLNVENLDLAIGQTYRLEAVITPEGASADDIQWISSKESVATVKDGIVTAVSEGRAVITVSCNGGDLTAECEVTVAKDAEEKVLVSSINMLSSLELQLGNTYALNVDVLPANATDKSVTFSLEGDCISLDAATGAVEALEVGTAKVTATANDGSGVKAECEVKVIMDSASEVTNVSIRTEGGVTDVQVGKPLQLHAEYLPEGVVPNTVSWTVDDQSRASVDQSGVVTGVEAVKGSDGDWSKVVVSVNADGQTSSISLRVIPRQPDGLSISLPEHPVKVGQSWELNPRLIPEELNEVFQLEMTMGSPVYNGVFCSYEPGHVGFGYYISDTYEDIVYRFVKYYAIDVEPYWVESVALPSPGEMEVGKSVTLQPVFTSDVEGVAPTYSDVVWSSSDPSVAEVDEHGTVTAVSPGTAEITVVTSHEWAVPAGTQQKATRCTVNVTEASSGSAKIGDYYYSDGTWSSDLKAGKTVVGIVFAKADATSADPLMARDYPSCTNGLVLGLTEYADQDFGAVSAYNGHSYYEGIGYDADAIVATDKVNGYGNTQAHRDLNASRPDYCTLFNAEDGVVAAHASAVASPASASAWYIPSYKEMQMIVENLDAVNASLEAAGGAKLADPYAVEESYDGKCASDWYWTSTIYGVPYKNISYDHHKYPFDLYNAGWTKYVQASGKCKVRVVLAF